MLLLHKNELQETEIEIRYPDMTQRIEKMIQHIRQFDIMLEGYREDKVYQIPLEQICYIETIDRKTFFYSNKNVYETRKTIQTIETELDGTTIVRISKSLLLNITAINNVKPYPNHRIMVELINGEHLIVSRKYIADLKEKIRSICSLIGTALGLRGLIALVLVVGYSMACYYARIVVEEEALRKHFGNEFTEYEKRTYRLLPFIW
ncbi:LytTR family transcriptional regulator DNA-binding domain-containing protein [Lacrimispora amygdalina]|uniref:LytTR family transcriptional regulator DNA-binding domain-containing protein n=1 Tax=Lacrimispora amygdalina TaxID=253257 RepID=UPI001FA87059|nr:LytTR family transcriptional regulator DNA-binding domain-containing protein [Lacrimispora amygdalina]